jgi:sortase A
MHGRADAARRRSNVRRSPQSHLKERTSNRALLVGVGHVRSTPYPGEPDNVALAGHRDTQFRRLMEVGDGDLIYLTTPDGRFLYRVDSVFIVRPSRVDLIRRTGRPMLTLVTCYPFHWIGPAPKRYIVRASQMAKPSEVARVE